ncbi:hypothetical protein [Mucilaginibacter agri]|uniref:DUF937 domain-containing protein n=1 Tax=Mucilaginibacter agri TaxID=2695265 RepID=A0A965ZCN9_9SPHI|nr:hypothetical protein [Mucilaginibacter agri]NCD68569.1 hypothetical protein [Mucilaginibacter agri]
MFDEILNIVKSHLGGNPEVADALPQDQAGAVHDEIATHIQDGIKNQAAEEGGIGGLLSSLKDSLTSGSPVTGAIEGGLAATLASKFGLSPAITGAIAGALPGILQKFTNKVNDPDDESITPQSLESSLADKFKTDNK